LEVTGEELFFKEETAFVKPQRKAIFSERINDLLGVRLISYKMSDTQTFVSLGQKNSTQLKFQKSIKEQSLPLNAQGKPFGQG
jgi:hypothetical protein